MTKTKLASLHCIVVLVFGLVGCKSLQFWNKDDAKADHSPENEIGETDVSTVHGSTSGSADEERELKLAKLWARVDELEEEQLRQKERLRVIEKGLTLGLVPDELKEKRPRKGKRQSAPVISTAPVLSADEIMPDAVAVVKADAKADAKAEPVASAARVLSKEENDKYQAALASAHDHFRAGRYGRAIVEYSDIDKVYGDRVEGGMPLYWIARCWINLKEYNTARQQLADFLKQNPGSPWSPRAKLELARVEWKLGLGETALQRFREIIQQHPYEDAAEMAKMELQNLDKSL